MTAHALAPLPAPAAPRAALALVATPEVISALAATLDDATVRLAPSLANRAAGIALGDCLAALGAALGRHDARTAHSALLRARRAVARCGHIAGPASVLGVIELTLGDAEEMLFDAGVPNA
ncbi:MAG: hypothetical protein WKG32_12105 [Gemmatimonadaceae bacterium]